MWFGNKNGITVDQQIALSTTMAVHSYHPKLYELLAPSMIGAIESGDSIVAGWHTQSNPLQRIGEWVINAIISGHQNLSNPVAHAFFTSAPAKLRGEALGHIAWAFMHAESVDETARDRFGDLWDSRMEHVRSHPDDSEELSGFYWFVKSNKFNVEWWLPRLKEAAELDPLLSSSRYMIGKEIASSADVNPRGAFDVLKLLLEGHDDADLAGFDLMRNAVPIVLAKAIASRDAELRSEAERYMNYLGEQGNLGLEAEVNEALNGKITQEDVDG
jgi:hypothetical protein